MGLIHLLLLLFPPKVLETITHPYSSDFVQLFLPMVENEEITGSMRGEGDNDPVSEFIGKFFVAYFGSRAETHSSLSFFSVHCKAHYMTV